MNLSQLFSILLVFILINAILAAKAKKSTATKKKPSSSEKTSSGGSSTTTTTEKSPLLSAATKLQKLEQYITSTGPIIELSDKNFSAFVLDRPRDFHAVVMLTATDSQYQCTVCVRTKTTAMEAAKAYYLQFNLTESSPQQRVVFFNLEAGVSRRVFADLGIETIPRIYVIPPATASDPRTSISEYEEDNRPFMEGLAPTLNMISETTKVKIQVLIDPKPVILGACLIAVLLALFVTVAYYDLFEALTCFQNPAIWSVVSMICFGVGVSGSIYCIIRSSPAVGINRQGQASLFAAQGREQFLVEGIIVAMWTLGCGVSLFFLNQATKMRRFPLLRHVLVLLFMSLFIVLAIEIWNAYTMKTMWYNLRDTLPSDVWAWLTGSVKKNSGLIKRLLRVSELWLQQSTDLQTLYKKFQQLVIDYLRRVVLQQSVPQ